jgi:HAE1 family hydrophobic/amphiphilic exporter-1
MTLSETCIRRPVLTTLVTASIIVLGIFAYRLLSVAALPAVDFPTINITGLLPGASAETMAASVAAPIERQLSTIAGISSLTSSSSLGITSITIQFDLNRSIDGAALDVQTALSVAARKLPVEMTIPPSFRKVNPGDFPVLYISLNSPTLPLSVIDEYGEITLAQQISQLATSRRCWSIARRNLPCGCRSIPWRGTAASRSRTFETSSRRPTQRARWHLNGPKQTVTLTASAAMTKAEEYRVVVAYRNGSPVYLDQIARVIDSVENDKIASWFNDNRAIVLASSASPMPTPSRSWIRSAADCRSTVRWCRRRSTWMS